MSTVDTYFADVSEFQVAVDDRYPFQVLSIRSDDGTYRDHKFAQNYRWAVNACNSGRLTCFIVYAYWRPNWADTVATMRDMVTAAGGPHPKMIAMLDIESGGNPGGNQSAGINAAHAALSKWLGDPRRVIGYANGGDFRSMWSDRPAGVRTIGAGYGQDPHLMGELAHQYTDGVYGAGQGLPMGCPPFGHCDMNVADGLSPDQFAAVCGVGGNTKGSIVGQTEVDQVSSRVIGWLEGFMPNLYKTAAAALKEQTGSPIVGQFKGFPELGNRTEVQALQAIGYHLGIDGFTAPAAPVAKS